MKFSILIFAAILTITAVPALAEEYGTGGQEDNPATEGAGHMMAPGVIQGGNYEQRGQANYEAHRDDQLNQIQKNQGDGAMLQQEQIERRNYHQN